VCHPPSKETNLGPSDTHHPEGVALSFVVKVTFGKEDNPADFKPLRDAIDPGGNFKTGNGVPENGGENPDNKQISNDPKDPDPSNLDAGPSQLIWDQPGKNTKEGEARSAMPDGNYTWSFALSEQNSNTKAQSGPTFYYQLTLTLKDGSIVGKPVPVQISAETYKAIRDNQGHTHTTNHPNNLKPPKKKKDKQPQDSGGI
jgi:hypothetical protein